MMIAALNAAGRGLVAVVDVAEEAVGVAVVGVEERVADLSKNSRTSLSIRTMTNIVFHP